MLSPRQFLIIPFLVTFVGVVAVSEASAQQVQAVAQGIQIQESAGLADVQFRIRVTNDESSMASNVLVVFEDGHQVGVGDVVSEGSALSAPQTRTIDLSSMPTRNFPLPVTLMFSLDGVNVELEQTLVFRLPVPSGGGQ